MPENHGSFTLLDAGPGMFMLSLRLLPLRTLPKLLWRLAVESSCLVALRLEMEMFANGHESFQGCWVLPMYVYSSFVTQVQQLLLSTQAHLKMLVAAY